MKSLKYIFLLIVLLSASCVKEKLHDPVTIEDPDPVKPDSIPSIPSTYLLVNIDWTNVETAGAGDEFQVLVNNQNFLLSKGQQLDTLDIEPQNYNICIYNKPSGITFNNEVTSMNKDSQGYLVSPSSNSFFSGSTQITADTGDVVHANMKPVQRMRNLKIFIANIPISDSITALSGKLTNVARSFNMLSEKEESPDSITFNLMDTCGLNLFGFIGTGHILEIKAASGTYSTRTGSVDISLYLNDFNTDKAQSKVITINYFDINFSAFSSISMPKKNTRRETGNYNNKLAPLSLENNRKINTSKRK